MRTISWDDCWTTTCVATVRPPPRKPSGGYGRAVRCAPRRSLRLLLWCLRRRASRSHGKTAFGRLPSLRSLPGSLTRTSSPFESARNHSRPSVFPVDCVTRRSDCVRAPALCSGAVPPEDRGPVGPASSPSSRGGCRPGGRLGRPALTWWLGRQAALTLGWGRSGSAPRWMLQVAGSASRTPADRATRGRAGLQPTGVRISWWTERARWFERRPAAVFRHPGKSSIFGRRGRVHLVAARALPDRRGGGGGIPSSDRERAEGFRIDVVRVIATLAGEASAGHRFQTGDRHHTRNRT